MNQLQHCMNRQEVEAFLAQNQHRTVCFTGHRPHKFGYGAVENSPHILEIKQQLKDAIEQAILEGYSVFVNGGAMGVDLWAAEAVLELKDHYDDISLITVLPYRAQTAGWPQAWKDRHAAIVANSEGVVCLAQGYYNGCLQARNRYMVQHCARVIGVYGDRTGGTKNTLEYAKSIGKQIQIITV